MKFYYAPHSCALASHIALEEAGAAYEAVRVNFAANEQRSADYMAINPKARVPSLVTSRGVLAQWWELDGVDPGRLPRLAAFRQRMAERAVVHRTILAETGEAETR